MITKGKPRGIPFQKGTDERRHLAGSKSKAALDFKAEFKRIFNEEVNVRKLVRTLLRKAEQGVPWALQEAFDRGMGKSVQFTDNKFENGEQVTFRVIYADPKLEAVRKSEEARRLTDEARTMTDALALQDPGPSLNARLALEAGAASRLLEAGKDAERAKDESQDYVEACKEA